MQAARFPHTVTFNNIHLEASGIGMATSKVSMVRVEAPIHQHSPHTHSIPALWAAPCVCAFSLALTQSTFQWQHSRLCQLCFSQRNPGRATCNVCPQSKNMEVVLHSPLLLDSIESRFWMYTNFSQTLYLYSCYLLEA